MKKLNELGDMGDRMMTGQSYSQGGAVGSSAGGSLDTYKSPKNSQNPDKFNTKRNKHTTSYDQDTAWDYVKSIEQIKDKVTPDEVITGITYEMKKQVVKDKQKAKQLVVKNLNKDPKYYSKLHMLGIDVDEKHEAMMEVLTILKAQRYAKKNGDFFK